MGAVIKDKITLTDSQEESLIRAMASGAALTPQLIDFILKADKKADATHKKQKPNGKQEEPGLFDAPTLNLVPINGQLLI